MDVSTVGSSEQVSQEATEQNGSTVYYSSNQGRFSGGYIRWQAFGAGASSFKFPCMFVACAGGSPVKLR